MRFLRRERLCPIDSPMTPYTTRALQHPGKAALKGLSGHPSIVVLGPFRPLCCRDRTGSGAFPSLPCESSIESSEPNKPKAVVQAGDHLLVNGPLCFRTMRAAVSLRRARVLRSLCHRVDSENQTVAWLRLLNLQCLANQRWRGERVYAPTAIWTSRKTAPSKPKRKAI